MFDFRIIETPDGNQIIDRQLKTPYDSLTLFEMIQYIEIDKHMYYMDCLEKKRQRAAMRKSKVAKSIFKNFACICEIMGGRYHDRRTT